MSNTQITQISSTQNVAPDLGIGVVSKCLQNIVTGENEEIGEAN